MSGLPGDPVEILESSDTDEEIKFISMKRKRSEERTVYNIASDHSEDEGHKAVIPRPLPKRARTTDHNPTGISTPQRAHGKEQTLLEEESDYECFDENPCRQDDFDRNIEDWPVPRVEMRIPKLRKSGEIELGPCLRRPTSSSLEEALLRTRPVTGARLSLLSCFPVIRSHKPRTWLQQRHSLGIFGFDASYPYHKARLRALPELRLGGCPNTITQSHGFAVIAANVHGADTDVLSPANHNGLTVISSASGAQLPLSSTGHARRIQGDHDARKEATPPAQSDQGTIYETVYDAQFDPAKPMRFITAGNDNRAIIWNIEETPNGEPRVTSARNGFPGTEYDKSMGSRPHFIRFSQNFRHWSDDEAPSAFVVSDAQASFHVEFPTGGSFPVRVDAPRREIASIVWGKGVSENVIFAGTEASGFLPDIYGGKQAGFLVHPSRGPIKQSYTHSRDEVEQLAINPAGNLIASFTRDCDTSLVLCEKCHRRGITSRHKLSIYPAMAMPNRSTRRGKSTVVAEVNLPKFTGFSNSDTANDAGLVVSAAWSPCGTFIAAARDDDFVDIFDSRYLGPLPLMRLRHDTPPRVDMYRPAYTLDGSFSDCERCVVLEKHPKHGITGLQWIEGSGHFRGEGLLSAGSDGCVRLWDVRRDNVCDILVQLETSAACISVGDISRKEISLIAADNDGLIEMRTSES